MALAAFGLFVGVGAVAVMNGNADGVMETSASFVDPSRAAGGKAAAAQPLRSQRQRRSRSDGRTGRDASRRGGRRCRPLRSPRRLLPSRRPPLRRRDRAARGDGRRRCRAAASRRSRSSSGARSGCRRRGRPEAGAPSRRLRSRARQPVAAAPVSRPARQAPAAEEPAAAAPKPTKPAKGGKGGGEVDDETKKALDELQKAQLERSF